MDQQQIERRRSQRRTHPRRNEERRQRAIPVVVNLRSGVDRRQAADRRRGSDRRSALEARTLVEAVPERCGVVGADGRQCMQKALVRGRGATGWICLEHLVSAGEVN